jgi:hypothetical protein
MSAKLSPYGLSEYSTSPFSLNDARCHYQLLAIFEMMWKWRTPFG